jgi:SAM-dependent methyltransferase
MNFKLLNQKNYYGKKYFFWQAKIGEFGGMANLIKFNHLISNNIKILDFGCGGGYLLKNIKFNNVSLYGVEINKTARDVAKKNGVKVYKNSNEIPSNFFDLIISNHALEHTDNPLMECKNLYRGLKKKGKICIVVPLDNKNYTYKKKDINFHLYSFSPMNLGNLLTRSGFKVLESKIFYHKWPPYYFLLKKIMPWSAFHFICKLYSKIDRKWFQTKCEAIKL